MAATDRVREIFADARALQADALEMLAQGRVRNAAEKAWGATKRATNALMLARTWRRAGAFLRDLCWFQDAGVPGPGGPESPPSITTTALGRDTRRCPTGGAALFVGALGSFVALLGVLQPFQQRGPYRSRGSISRTTRYTCGRVIRGIFFPHSCCKLSRKAPPSRHRAIW